MRNFSTWLVVMFMAMFWVFRVIVALMAQLGKDFGGFIAFNLNIEIAVLFITLICFLLVVKRKMLGPIIYVLTYGYYFGSYLLTSVFPILTSGEEMGISLMQNGLVALIGIVLAVFSFFDLLVDKQSRKDPKDKKTDWYYKDDKYDRKLDERADKNQYRTL